MKKIITAAAIAAMVTSFAAAEVTVSLNARTQSNMYDVEKITKNGNTDAHTETVYADLGKDNAKDTLAIKGSTDYAGVVAEIDVNTSKATAFKTYYGWVNWGAFKVTAGAFESRYTNRGAYTATEGGILDNGDATKRNSGFQKGLGTSGEVGGVDTVFLKDFGNVSGINGTKDLALLADYTFSDVAGGSLLLKGGFVQNNKAAKYDDYTSSDGDEFSQNAGYVAEAAWRKDSTVALDFIFKNPLNKAYGFGVYVTPLMIPNTTNVVLGFTYGTYKDNLKNAFAIDLRGQYNISDAAVAALGFKYESAKEDKDGAKQQSAMQIAGEFSYKVNDIFTAALDLGYFNTDLDNEDKDDDDGSQTFVTSLRGKFSAGKNAAITTAVDFEKVLNPKDGETDYAFSIPVVLRVKM